MSWLVILVLVALGLFDLMVLALCMAPAAAGTTPLKRGMGTGKAMLIESQPKGWR